MWEQLLNDVLTTSIKYLLPILLGFIITWVGLMIKTEWENIKAKRPDIIKLVIEYAPILVGFLEMERKKNNIDLLTVKAEGERLIIAFLATKGIELNFDNPIWDLIESVIEAEVRKLPKFSFDSDK